PLLSDEHKWDYKKALKICDRALKRFHDSNGAIQCENLQNSILTKSIQGEVESSNIPNQVFRSLLSYRNVKEVYYRIIKTNRTEVSATRKRFEKDYTINREKEFL